MIRGQFKLASELIDVVVKGNELLFLDVGTGMITPISGLRFSKAGTLKEHPDLKDNPNWKKIAMDRLTEHIKSFKLEMDKMRYVKEELVKFGYEPMHLQRAGFRPQRF